MTDRSVTDSA